MKSTLVFTFALVSLVCGSPAREGRIVGGKDAGVGQFPYIVSLRIKATNQHGCGGSIISNRWILSAAHCTSHTAARDLVIVAGALKRLTGGTPYDIERIVQHDFDWDTLENDVSMLKTKTSMVFNDLVQPIPLGQTITGAGVDAIVAGWGLTSGHGLGRLADHLQWLDSITISNEDCEHDALGLPVFESTLCAVSRVGTGPCTADSGGPLVADNKLIGIVSFGDPACNRGFPDGYARVSFYRPWILEKIESF